MTGAELGRFGVWRSVTMLTDRFAPAVEEYGYGALWIGGSPPGDLAIVDQVLAATTRLRVATGIVNIWRDDARTVAASFLRIEARYPGRFLLGIGAGHREQVGAAFARPYDALVRYLDELDDAGVPAQRRVLAALGPRVLRLAAARTAGAHPYLTTPEHTRQAREILGPGPLLAPEHKAVLDSDPVRARAAGRARVEKPYLGLSNYTNNLRRLGFADEDLAGSGSDRLVDALVAHGTPESVVARLNEHLDAGADHVIVQLLTADPEGDPLPGLQTLATALQL
jgi:probable F420-dependent oxidoreductase